MQPSNQLKGLVEAYTHVGSEETAQLKMYEKTVVNTIGVYMASEGYDKSDIIEFLSDASEGKIGEKFQEALESEVASKYITEEGEFNTNLRYVEGAIYESAKTLIMKGATGLKRFIKGGFRKTTGIGAKPKVTTNPVSGTTIIKQTGSKRRTATAAVGSGTAAAGLEDKDKEAIRAQVGKLRSAGAAGIKAAGRDYQKNSFEQEGEQIAEIDFSWLIGGKKNKPKAKEEKPQNGGRSASEIARDSKDIKKQEEDPLSDANKADREKRAAAAQAAADKAAADKAAKDAKPKPKNDGDVSPARPVNDRVASIRADSSLSAKEKWEKANPRLAKVAKLRKSGASRAEINKAMYKKGTKAYGEETEVQEGLGQALTGLSKKMKTSDNPAAKAVRALVTPVGKGTKTARPAAGSTPGQKGGGKMTREGNEVELVSSFLVSEGFSDNVEGALAMLEGMSESWFNEILDVRLMEEYMLEYLQVMGEAESRDEALYIVSEMDEEAIDLLANEVEDIIESNS